MGKFGERILLSLEKKNYFANYLFILLGNSDLVQYIFEKDFTGITDEYPLPFPCLAKIAFENPGLS